MTIKTFLRTSFIMMSLVWSSDCKKVSKYTLAKSDCAMPLHTDETWVTMEGEVNWVRDPGNAPFKVRLQVREPREFRRKNLPQLPHNPWKDEYVYTLDEKFILDVRVVLPPELEDNEDFHFLLEASDGGSFFPSRICENSKHRAVGDNEFKEMKFIGEAAHGVMELHGAWRIGKDGPIYMMETLTLNHETDQEL